jgi:pimeloyl-ACP methyl ester carboxylesterase
MASSAAQKSTNVRITSSALQVMDRIAPAVAARAVTRTWFRLPAGPPATRLPDGGAPFEQASQGSVVRGHAWGDGPVVYLVHGWAGRGGQLAAFVEPLVHRGHRVVLFDGLSHGDSGPGPSGARTSNGVELARSLDDVATRFGPAAAVVAHSMGAVATLLAVRHGWLGTDRLALLAPMTSYAGAFTPFAEHLGLSTRTRELVDRAVARRVGLPTEEFDVAFLAGEVEPVPTLVVHDRGDRQTPYAESVRLVEGLPDARMITTQGLGHRRLLTDPAVVGSVASFVAGAELAAGLPTTA